MEKIGVIGLGYVGLPLSLKFAEANTFRVTGFDVDPQKVNALNAGRSFIQHIPAERVAAARQDGRFEATTDFSRLGDCDAVLICVPTPLGPHREPDLSYVIESGRVIGKTLRRGQLIVLESTTYPGTTEEDLRAVLEEASGLVAGRDFLLAYSPEREDPGNPGSRLEVIPKVVGGLTPACTKAAAALYSAIVGRVVEVSSCRVAEACKLLENIFRCVNIALVNELKVVCSAMGIDIWEVINASSTKPFGFMPFYPGPGLGGHCIPIDPFYLTWKAHEYGQHTRFIELAGEINRAMPVHVVTQLQQALNTRGCALKGSRILIIGLAYKPNVDDTRESPAYVLIKLLRAQGAVVEYHDPHVPEVPPTREHADCLGMKSAPFTQADIGSFTAVLICTAHVAVDYAKLGEWSSLIIDTRNAMGAWPQFSEKVVKA